MGLIALVGVGLVVGLLVSGGALAATQMLGFTGGKDDSGATDRQSLYLPRPSKTDASSGPAVTLAPGESSAPADSSSAPPEFLISLSAGETEVSAMAQIDLTGTYPGGEGHILQVQRFENGGWQNFADVTTAVTNQTFSTYVETAKTGMNRFRVIDTDSQQASNEVRVRVD
jgi:hypothetical protein